MNNKKLIDYIKKKPDFFGNNIKSIKLIETHISYIFLTGDFAYKIKKPVDYGFLDFSTLQKRKYYCNEELNLNKRLCRDIYLEVLPITKNKEKIELNGKGNIIEYTLKMNEFSQEEIMNNLLKKDEIKNGDIKKINKILINFYKSTKKSEDINKYGKTENIEKNINENFEQTKSYINEAISEETYYYIKEIVRLFLKEKDQIFNKRILNNCIHDCHGDLHTGNIVISKNDIYIFDCIEFNKRFRYCDTASDIGFLAMDLDYLNHPYTSSYLIRDYIKNSKDRDFLQVLNFYKCYRAYVRGKVLSFNLNDVKIKKEKYNIILNEAKKYFELSKYYSTLLKIDINSDDPLLFIISGLTGTGKSTLSMKLSIDYNAKVINTDVIRKKIAGIDIFEKHHDDLNTGLYSPKKILYTYEKVIEQAKKYLSNDNNVIIDATFQKKKYREMLNKAAEEFNIEPIYIQCTAPDKIVKKWLNERLKTKTVSDGRWEIYKFQKKTFESFDSGDNYLIVDMSKDSFEDRTNFFNMIQSKIIEGL